MTKVASVRSYLEQLNKLQQSLEIMWRKRLLQKDTSEERQAVTDEVYNIKADIYEAVNNGEVYVEKCMEEKRTILANTQDTHVVEEAPIVQA